MKTTTLSKRFRYDILSMDDKELKAHISDLKRKIKLYRKSQLRNTKAIKDHIFWLKFEFYRALALKENRKKYKLNQLYIFKDQKEMKSRKKSFFKQLLSFKKEMR